MNFRRGTLRIRVAAIIIREGKILLVAHKKNNNIYWLLPGGGVHFGESLKEALKREVMEELGISVSVHDLILVNDSIDDLVRKHIVNVCFSCTYQEGEYQLGRERRLYNYGFFSKDEIPDMTIFPPFNNELVKVLDGEEIDEIYQEKKWIPL